MASFDRRGSSYLRGGVAWTSSRGEPAMIWSAHRSWWAHSRWSHCYAETWCLFFSCSTACPPTCTLKSQWAVLLTYWLYMVASCLLSFSEALMSGPYVQWSRTNTAMIHKLLLYMAPSMWNIQKFRVALLLLCMSYANNWPSLIHTSLGLPLFTLSHVTECMMDRQGSLAYVALSDWLSYASNWSESDTH